MCKFRLLTDSTADLPASLVEELDLQVYPMAFVLEEKAYRDYPDGRELDIHAFYESLRHGKMSSSSQINQQQMVDWVSPFLENGEDVLYLSFSSGLSGTYQSARLAQEELRERFPDRTFTVVDSLCASMGEGLLAYYAAAMRQKGCTLKETAAWLEENKLKLCHWFTVDDLHHLKRGGRVSPATAVVGTMLNIKPVLHVDDNGHLIPMEKVRGRRQSLEALVRHMKETVENPEEQMIFISHGDCPQDAEYVAGRIRETMTVRDIRIHTIGPVIGTHSGPGTVALFFLGSHR
ncbi:MAG TPA: DegV family protein [Firmicutes bacterium]|nr:DegV family protein [Bacillota bacterium]